MPEWDTERSLQNKQIRDCLKYKDNAEGLLEAR